MAPGEVALFPAFIVRCIDMRVQSGHVEGGVFTENATQRVLQVFTVDMVGHVATPFGLMPTNQADALGERVMVSAWTWLVLIKAPHL